MILSRILITGHERNIVFSAFTYRLTLFSETDRPSRGITCHFKASVHNEFLFLDVHEKIHLKQKFDNSIFSFSIDSFLDFIYRPIFFKQNIMFREMDLLSSSGEVTYTVGSVREG
jgi:hypothetical protein